MLYKHNIQYVVKWNGHFSQLVTQVESCFGIFQSYEIKSPPWAILGSEILEIFSVEY